MYYLLSMSNQVTNNTFGALLGEGLQGNGIISKLTADEEEFGGEDPTFTVKMRATTASETAPNITIVVGGGIGSAEGGNISNLLGFYLRDLLTKYTQPFLEGKIEENIKPALSDTIGNTNNTLYLQDISNISLYAPEPNSNSDLWTDNELIASFALSSLGVVNRGLLLFLDNENLKLQVDTIAEQIRNELITKVVNPSAGLMIDVTTSASIDMRYLYYVDRYGAPVNGIFDPVKLAEFV